MYVLLYQSHPSWNAGKRERGGPSSFCTAAGAKTTTVGGTAVVVVVDTLSLISLDGHNCSVGVWRRYHHPHWRRGVGYCCLTGGGGVGLHSKPRWVVDYYLYWHCRCPAHWDGDAVVVVGGNVAGLMTADAVAAVVVVVGTGNPVVSEQPCRRPVVGNLSLHSYW